MSPEKKFGILFDYNGVLADDEALHENAAAQAVAAYGVNLTSEAYREHCLGRTDRTSFGNLKRAYLRELALVTVADLMDARLRHYQELAAKQNVLYPDAPRVLRELHDAFVLGLVTSSWRAEVIPPLANAGVADYFKTLVALDDITQGKPHPEGYLKGLAGLGLPAQHVVVIEDTKSGVAAGKAAGLKVIALLHTTPRAELTQADHILPALSDLTPAFMQQVLLPADARSA